MGTGMLTDQVIYAVLRRLPGQSFSIRRVQKLWTPQEAARLEQELAYMAKEYTLEKVVDGYVYYTNAVIEETKYFHEHDDYRYHSFAEVDRNVYANKENMTLYMLGLSLTEYLWETVLRIHRFFEAVLQDAKGENYLEIGPGHGKYFCEAYNLGRFKKYVAIDVSPTAIAMTEQYMQSHKNDRGGVYELICQDATQLDSEERKYDFVVLQEVLEHLENPLEMLKTTAKLLSAEGTAYLLMPICAPSPQHIFLFQNRKHVQSLIQQADLEIIKEDYITVNRVSVETAEEKRMPIDACLLVRKRTAAE